MLFNNEPKEEIKNPQPTTETISEPKEEITPETISEQASELVQETVVTVVDVEIA